MKKMNLNTLMGLLLTLLVASCTGVGSKYYADGDSDDETPARNERQKEAEEKPEEAGKKRAEETAKTVFEENIKKNAENRVKQLEELLDPSMFFQLLNVNTEDNSTMYEDNVFKKLIMEKGGFMTMSPKDLAEVITGGLSMDQEGNKKDAILLTAFASLGSEAESGAQHKLVGFIGTYKGVMPENAKRLAQELIKRYVNLKNDFPGVMKKAKDYQKDEYGKAVVGSIERIVLSQDFSGFETLLKRLAQTTGADASVLEATI